MFILKILFYLSVSCLTTFTFGEELDKYSAEALSKTKALLQNQAQREDFVQNNPDAQGIDAKIDKLVGDNPEDKQKLYRLAASIMEKMTNESGGDSQKMLEKLMESQGDPKKFYDTFGAEHKEALRQLGESIESRQNNQNKP